MDRKRSRKKPGRRQIPSTTRVESPPLHRVGRQALLDSLLVLIVGVLVFANSLGNDFVYDDISMIVENPRLDTPRRSGTLLQNILLGRCIRRGQGLPPAYGMEFRDRQLAVRTGTRRHPCHECSGKRACWGTCIPVDSGPYREAIPGVRIRHPLGHSPRTYRGRRQRGRTGRDIRRCVGFGSCAPSP